MKKECDLQKNGPDEKNQEANLKKGGSKIEKKYRSKKSQPNLKKKGKKNFKRSENLMEKKCVIEKKGKKTRNNISQICFRGGKKEHNYRKCQLFIIY